MDGFLRTTVSIILSAYSWIVIFAVTGVLAICYGVFLIYGSGSCLITLGAFLLVFSTVIARGAANG